MRNCQGAEKQMEAKRRKRKESVQMEMNNGTVSAVWRRFRLMGNRGRLKFYGVMRWCLDSPETAAFWCLLVACIVLIMIFGLIFWLIQLFNPPSMTTVGELPTEKLAPSKPYNSTKAQSIVESLCSEWRSGRYAGDFCETLCHGDVGISRNWTLADYTRGGNKHVMKLRIDGLDTVLKMQFPFANEYDQQIDFDLVDEEQFTDKLLEIVNEHLQLGWPRRHKGFLLRKIWPALTADVGATGHRRWRALDVAEKRSVWALLQQDEFITSAVLQMSRVTPRLLGVCGHAYLVEYLVPFRMKPYYLNLKAKILVHLMGTLKLFYEFLNEPFQWCDVKFDNLGLSANYPKRFVVMDSDMLYTESRLNTMLQTQKCSNDTECGLFDCASQCNATTGYCTGRTNSNLEVFCKKLIIQQLFGTYWSKSNRYLSVCHEPGTYSEHLKSLQLTWAWSLSDV